MLNNTGIWVIIPNWNGGELTAKCLDSLALQTKKHSVVVVDNASTDNSAGIIKKSFPEVGLIQNKKNLGFAGGVNVGIKEALENNAEYIVLLNNDVTLEKNWLEELQKTFNDRKTGAVTGKLLSKDGKKVDNTGDEYSIWGLTIPRQRGASAKQAEDKPGQVFGACAGAAMYSAKAMKDNGFFDEKFFAYYEDTDYNFRLQLRDWKVMYQPKAVGYHATGSTSSKISGFTTLQTTKNLPMLFWKNVPWGIMPKMLPRFFIVYLAIFFSSVLKGNGPSALKGSLLSVKNIPYTLVARSRVQRSREVSDDYVRSILYQDLPPTAKSLRRLRSFFTLGRS